MGEPSAQVVDTGHGSDEQRQKKAAGNAAHQQGDECIEGAGVPATPPSLTSLRCRGRRLRTAKKRGCSLSTPAFDALPLHRRSTLNMTRGSATGRRHHDKTMGVVSNPRKRQASLAATGKALIWALWCRPLRQLCFNPRHDRNRPQQNRHGVRTACVVYLLTCFSHCNGFPRDLLMRSTSRRLALDHRFASTVLWSLFAALIFQALASR